MTDDALDVLMYLFENYVGEDDHCVFERDTLQVELYEAGFPELEIDRAFDWLECLQADDFAQTYVQLPGSSFRIYADEEQRMLNRISQGYLLFLEQKGILEPASREVVIDYVMALGCEDLDLERLRWLILMVLFNQPDSENAYAGLQDLILKDIDDQLH